MMTRIHGQVHFECDDCGDVLDTESKDFDSAVLILKNENWSSEKIGDVWRHCCPLCGGG